MTETARKFKAPGGVWAGIKAWIVPQTSNTIIPRGLLNSTQPENLTNKPGTPDTTTRAGLLLVPIAIALCSIGFAIANGLHLIP